MKKMIIILGTVLLGVAIVVTMIMSDTGLKGTAKGVVDRSDKITQEVIKIDPTK